MVAINPMKNLAFLFISTLLFGACSSPAPEEQQISEEENTRIELSEESARTLGLETAIPQYRSLHHSLNVTGVLDVPPDQKQSITLSYPGKITRIPLINGMHVHKGELLYEIENPVFIQMQEDYLIAKSNLELAEKNLGRQEVLSTGKVNAEKDLDQAKNEVNRLLAQKNALMQKLRMLHINPETIKASALTSKAQFRADADYWVQQVNVNKGSYASEGDVVMELINLNHIHVELAVFEKDIHEIKIRQKIQFQLPHEAEKRNAEVYLIGRTVKTDRTIQVHGHLEKEDNRLLPGTFVQAQILIELDSALTLPSSALQQWGGKFFLFEKVGINEYEMLEIPRPLVSGDWIYADKSLLNRHFAISGTFQLLSSLKNTAEEE